jgi:peptide chain release factor 3
MLRTHAHADQTATQDLNFVCVPLFRPRNPAPGAARRRHKSEKLRQALRELAEEGVVQLFRPQDGGPPMVGVVGTLQLDVLQARMAAEYGIGIGFDPPPFQLARWVSGERAVLEKFVADQRSAIADDVDGDPVFLATSPFMMRRTVELNPGLVFRDIKDHRAEQAAA